MGEVAIGIGRNIEAAGIKPDVSDLVEAMPGQQRLMVDPFAPDTVEFGMG